MFKELQMKKLLWIVLLTALAAGACKQPTDGGDEESPPLRLAGEIGFVPTAADSSQTVFDLAAWEGAGTALETWRLGALPQTAVYFAVQKTADQSLDIEGADADRVSRAEAESVVDGSTAGAELEVLTVDTADLGIEGGALEFVLVVSQADRENRQVRVCLDVEGGSREMFPPGLYRGGSLLPLDLEHFPGDDPLARTFSFLQRNAEADTTYTLILDRNVSSPPRALGLKALNYKRGVTLVLLGRGGERTIGLSGEGSLFTVSNAKLVVGDGITLKGRTIGVDGAETNNAYAALVGIYANGTLELLEGGELSGNTAPVYGGVHVVSGGVFDMKGGTITGNTPYGVENAGTFRMSGGTITANSTAGLYFVSDPNNHPVVALSGGIINANGPRGDLYIAVRTSLSLLLSGTARIGVLDMTAGTGGSNWRIITLGRGFSGGVDIMHLRGNNTMITTKDSWSNKALLLNWEDPDQSGLFPVEKFPLGNFVYQSTTEPVGATYHLDPQTGRLVAN
jgi:hypothetical protein